MTTEEPHVCELYLIIQADRPAIDRLGAVLDAVDIPTVLIASPSDAPLTAELARPLVELAQSREVAALIDNDPSLARALRADGCHLRPAPDILARYEDARDVVGGRQIVGASAGKSKHDAMSLGEADADYVAFGAPPILQDIEKARSTRNRMIEWWAELFEIPSVAFDTNDIEQARQTATLGADFVTLTIPQGTTPADAIASAIDYAAMLQAVYQERQP